MTRWCALTRVMSRTLEPHRARRQRPQPRDRAHHRRLAGAVGAEQCHQLALPHHQRNAVQCLDPAVVHHDVTDLEQRVPVSEFVIGHSQVGRDDCGVLRMSAGSPSAILRPNSSTTIRSVTPSPVACRVRSAARCSRRRGSPGSTRSGPAFSLGLKPAAGSSRHSSFGLGGQGPGDLQPALIAVGQVLRLLLRTVRNADELQQRRAFRWPNAPRGGDAGCGSAPRHRGAVPGVGADDDVLQGGHLAPQPDVLEGARDTAAGDLVAFDAAQRGPSKVTEPELGLYTPVIALKQVVLLPAPLGPINPRISPRLMAKLTASSAVSRRT